MTVDIFIYQLLASTVGLTLSGIQTSSFSQFSAPTKRARFKSYTVEGEFG